MSTNDRMVTGVIGTGSEVLESKIVELLPSVSHCSSGRYTSACHAAQHQFLDDCVGAKLLQGEGGVGRRPSPHVPDHWGAPAIRNGGIAICGSRSGPSDRRRRSGGNRGSRSINRGEAEPLSAILEALGNVG